MVLAIILLLGVSTAGQASWHNPYHKSAPADTTKGMIYDTPEIMPQFPGGPTALDAFVRKHKKYPEEARAQQLSGKVYVQFVVEKDGTISHVEVRMGRHKPLNDEAVRIVRQMPKWKPGSNRNKIVRTRYTLPITFHP